MMLNKQTFLCIVISFNIYHCKKEPSPLGANLLLDRDHHWSLWRRVRDVHRRQEHRQHRLRDALLPADRKHHSFGVTLDDYASSH
jgi:hypothetical protein